MRQLSTLDMQFLAAESSRTFGHLGWLGIYDPSTAPDGRLDREVVTRVVRARIDRLPPLRQRLVQVPLGLDLPYWAEVPGFDPGTHIRVTRLPAPGDDRTLAETAARLCARQLDRDRPLWRLHVIEGLAGGRVALLTVLHHALADGIAANALLATLLGDAPAGHAPAPPVPEPIPSGRSMLARGLLGPPRALGRWRRYPEALAAITEIPGAVALPGMLTAARAYTGARRALGSGESAGVDALMAHHPPRTPFSDGPTSGRRRAAFGSLSLDAMRAVGRAFGVTVNDVLVTVCAGAVRAWLLERAALPADPLVALIPRDVRRPAEHGVWGNRIAALIVPIATNEPDPRRRLERTHELMSGAKERHAAITASLLHDSSGLIPPPLMGVAARATLDLFSRAFPPVNLVISNIPDPGPARSCAGARLEGIHPLSVVADGMGLNITAVGHGDRLGLGIMGDREQVDDAWALFDGARRALAELEALLEPCGKGASSTGR